MEFSELRPLADLSGPGVLLVSERAPGTAAAGAIANDVAAAGGHCRDRIGIVEAAGRIARDDNADLLILDLEGMAAPLDEAADRALDVLLAGLDDRAGRQHAAILVIAPTPCIDRVFALASHPAIAILAAPDSDERRAEIRALLTPLARRLNDAGDSAAMRLLQLREEVARIARSLSSLSGGEPLPPPAPPPEKRAVYEAPVDAATVRLLIRARRLREQFFAPALFADPAWDMLLDLMAARLEGQPVAVSSLCIAAAVPPTTALRWIRALQDSRLIEREADPGDRRRVFIRLAEQAATALARYFGAAQRIGALPV